MGTLTIPRSATRRWATKRIRPAPPDKAPTLPLDHETWLPVETQEVDSIDMFAILTGSPEGDHRVFVARGEPLPTTNLRRTRLLLLREELGSRIR